MYKRQVIEDSVLNEPRDLLIHNYRIYQIDEKDVPTDKHELWRTDNPHVLMSNSILKPLKFQFSTNLKQQFQDMYSLAAGYSSAVSFDRRSLEGGDATSRIWGSAQPTDLTEEASPASRLDT